MARQEYLSQVAIFCVLPKITLNQLFNLTNQIGRLKKNILYIEPFRHFSSKIMGNIFLRRTALDDFYLKVNLKIFDKKIFNSIIKVNSNSPTELLLIIFTNGGYRNGRHTIRYCSLP